MQSIYQIVQQALRHGYLTPKMTDELYQLYDDKVTLSHQEHVAYDQLMAALLTGEVIIIKRKQFINIMEELVLSQAITRVGTLDPEEGQTLNLGDIVAYALNRLPPLYATTQEGANFQRQGAYAQHLQQLIQQQVEEAIAQSRYHPRFIPERQALQSSNEKAESIVITRISSLLQETALPLNR